MDRQQQATLESPSWISLRGSAAAPELEGRVWAPLYSRWSEVYSHALVESLVQDLGVLPRPDQWRTKRPHVA